MKKRSLKAEILDFLAMISMIFGLLFLSMWVVYYIVENYVDVDSIFGGSIGKNKVYILKSVNNEKYIPYLKKILQNKYSINVVNLEVLLKKKKGLLFLINTRNLTNLQISDITKFVKQGGSIIFNYSDERLVKAITHLKSQGVLQKGKYTAQTPLLSTFKIDKQTVTLYDNVYLYDKVSVLDFTKNHTSYGVMWEGNFGKGNWLYYSFPFYVLKDNDLKFIKRRLQSASSQTIRLLNDMVNFVYYGFKVVKYPYVDVSKLVLIDEYMDYKYNDNFMKYMDKHNLRGTIFINPNIVHHKINVDNNIEIASSSMKEKWKLEKYTAQKIIGFSNENLLKIDVDKLYNKYGFKYILSNDSSNGIYYDDFVVLAHNGFNDISLNDNINEIKQNIDFYTKYRIYTFTIHSYILGEKDNFKELDKILPTLKKYPIFTAKEIAQKYKDTARISMSAMLTPASLAVKIVNDSLKQMKNVTFRVYSKFKFDRIESNFFNIRAHIIKQTPEYIDVRVEKMNKNIEFYLRFK